MSASSVLCEVLTPEEVAYMWRVNMGSVRWRVNRGAFAYRYTSGGRLLIERSSVVAVWGAPVRDGISVMDVVDIRR